MCRKAVVMVLLASLAISAGCKQPCFMTECDYGHYRSLGVQAGLECNPATPPSDHALVAAPATVLNPEREPKYLSLAEAIAMALEHGYVGVQNPILAELTNSRYQDTTLQFQGRSLFGSDSIRVLALDPAIAANDIEAALAKFDARWVNSMSWNTADRPVATASDTFQASRALVNAISLQSAQFTSSVLKPLPTGGVAGITFRTDYELSNLQPRVNPSYRPSLIFQFEQPLLQGFGVDINQLRANHPGSIISPFTNVSRAIEGILITRLRFDQARAEFERNVQIMLANVEVAYWNLYGQYWNLYSREQALRQSFEAYKINKARYEAGRIAIADLAQTRGQYELFRSQRLSALGQVLEAERQLRGMCGLPVEDGERLVPTEAPTLAPYVPDWNTALQEALAMRPDLIMAREELKVRQLELINAKNLLLPDVRATMNYDINGLGPQLDGSNGAFKNLASNHFNNFGIGLRGELPFGFRDAHAFVRTTRLNLARSYEVLRTQEDKAQRYLALQYRNLFENYELIKAIRSQREAFAQQLDARFKEFIAGRGTLDFLLEAQRFWADALANEARAIVEYQKSLAAFQLAKGTIMQYDNVNISEGPLPQCAQVRAIEHARQRTSALVLRERAEPAAAAVAQEAADGVEGAMPAAVAEAAAFAPDKPLGPAVVEKQAKVPDRLDVPAAPQVLETTRPSLPARMMQGPGIGGAIPSLPASKPMPAPLSGSPANTGPQLIPLPVVPPVSVTPSTAQPQAPPAGPVSAVPSSLVPPLPPASGNGMLQVKPDGNLTAPGDDLWRRAVPK